MFQLNTISLEGARRWAQGYVQGNAHQRGSFGQSACDVGHVFVWFSLRTPRYSAAETCCASTRDSGPFSGARFARRALMRSPLLIVREP